MDADSQIAIDRLAKRSDAVIRSWDSLRIEAEAHKAALAWIEREEIEGRATLHDVDAVQRAFTGATDEVSENVTRALAVGGAVIAYILERQRK